MPVLDYQGPARNRTWGHKGSKYPAQTNVDLQDRSELARIISGAILQMPYTKPPGLGAVSAPVVGDVPVSARISACRCVIG
jgi:hypothetical protein